MATMRRELVEEVLKKVNGGFYYDTENMILGISKDGPLYKFADPERGELVRDAYLFTYPDGEEPTPEEEQTLDCILKAWLEQGLLIPYQA